MADTQPLAPTDAELLGLNVGEVYFSESPSKYPEVHGTQYHAGAPGVLAFARAVLAKWGQPAHSGEPGYLDRLIDRLSMPPQSMLASDLRALHDEAAVMLHLLRSTQVTAPQPVAREPLTDERLREIERMHVYAHTATLMDFARSIERAHGITTNGRKDGT